MKKLALWAFTFLLAAGLACATSRRGASEQTFVGNIGDSMCGLKHMMGGGDKACTEECVKGGAKYILADEANQKVYQLSDQGQASKFPGEKVKVTGALKGDTIQVKSIEAAP